MKQAHARDGVEWSGAVAEWTSPCYRDLDSDEDEEEDDHLEDGGRDSSGRRRRNNGASGRGGLLTHPPHLPPRIEKKSVFNASVVSARVCFDTSPTTRRTRAECPVPLHAPRCRLESIE